MTARVSEQGRDTANPRNHGAEEGGNEVAEGRGLCGEVESRSEALETAERTQEVISSDLTT